MIKRLLLLNGLAVLCLPLHHASGYGFQAMFDWTDRYLAVQVPDYSQVGSLSFYIIVLIQQLDYFALPAFMFASGFFAAIATGGKEPKLKWQVIKTRVFNLFLPFLIWTVIFFIFFARRAPNNLDELLDRYYYIPLLMQFYLIAPLLVSFAKKRPKLMLAAAAFLELGRFTFRYLDKLNIVVPGHDIALFLTPRWLFPMLFFWFALGMVANFYRQPLTRWMEQAKWKLLAAAVVTLVLSMVEYVLYAQATGQQWLGPYFGGFARQVYALAFILCFLAFNSTRLPFSGQISELGSKSLGVYLVHSRIMFVVAVLMYQLTPWMLGSQLIYQLVLIIVSLAGSLLIMEAVKKSPVRPIYRYVFG